MKKLFAILTIAAAMALISCSQYEEPVQPVNNIEEMQPVVLSQSFPKITITGGVFTARGRWQARVTVYNPMSQSVVLNDIMVAYYHSASKQYFSSQKESTTLDALERRELFLDFDKLPGGLKVGQICQLDAYADCPTLTLSIFSETYYATLK